MERSRAQELIRKYKEGTLTEQERAVLESWYLKLARSGQAKMTGDRLEQHLDEIWASLPGKEKPVRTRIPVRPLISWTSIAASVLILCMAGVYFFYQKPHKTEISKNSGGDAAPGDNRAVLTLANGEVIALSNRKNGELAHEGSTAIIKTKEGEIEYLNQSGALLLPENKGISYNTIATPKAGQYQVKLPDGTRVWLNAASSIRFPTVFSEKERVVEIKGEVYFEVAKATSHAKKVPFKVQAGKQTVEVLGTRFNVNSYADEGSIKTTLLEGSILLNINGDKAKEVLLKPGQQAQFIPDARKQSAEFQLFKVREVDAKSIVAWKDGYFQIDNIGLPELMRQLSRWYDVDVVYERPVKDYEFVGQIDRSMNLSGALKILELSDVHCRIEGKKIIVTN